MSNDQNIMEKNISRERVFDGIILHIDHLTNELPNGKTAKREVAVHIGASAVLPVDDEGNVYLVRQYRAPIDQVLLEIPAGKLDAVDEDRLEAAKRELREETGYTAENWTKLCDMFSSAGFSNEKISIYLADGLKAGDTDLDDDEFVSLVKIPYAELLAMAQRGEIEDSKTLIAIGLARDILGAKGIV